MLPTRLSRSQLFCQLPPLFLGIFSGGLSLWFTFCFCRNLWPTQASLAIAALGLLWECSKLYFGPRSLRGLWGGSWSTKVANVPLMALTGIMMTGSVAASLGFTLQAEHSSRVADNQAQAKTLLLSGVLQSAQADLRLKEREIATLVEIQAQQLAIHHYKAALQTADALSQRYATRDEAASRVAQITMGTAIGHSNEASSPEAAFFAALSLILGMEPDSVRKGVHLTIAIVLELIGVASFTLLHFEGAARTVERKASQCSPKPAVSRVVPESDTKRLVALKGEKIVNNQNSTVLSNKIGQCLRQEEKPSLVDWGDNDGIGDAFFDRYQQARVLLAEKRIAPTYRSLQRALQISQVPAKRFLLALQKEGMLKRVGNRYKNTAAA